MNNKNKHYNEKRKKRKHQKRYPIADDYYNGYGLVLHGRDVYSMTSRSGR